MTNMESDIKVTINIIAGILVRKGIKCFPVDPKYIVRLDPYEELTILYELLMHLNCLFEAYLESEKSSHPHFQKLNYFYNKIQDNDVDNMFYRPEAAI